MTAHVQIRVPGPAATANTSTATAHLAPAHGQLENRAPSPGTVLCYSIPVPVERGGQLLCWDPTERQYQAPRLEAPRFEAPRSPPQPSLASRTARNCAGPSSTENDGHR